MIWPSCSTIISLAHIFAGQKYCRSVHSQLDSANWEELAIQRLLRATASGHPERQPLKSGARSSASATAVSVECIEPPPPTLLQVEPVADVVCSLAYGSWHCRCPRCLNADRVS